MKITTISKVWTICNIDEEQVKIIKEYAEENGLKLEDAVWKLYKYGELDLYEDSNESEFQFESIEKVEEEE